MWLKSKERVEGDAMGGGADLLFLKKPSKAALKMIVYSGRQWERSYTGKDLEPYAPSTSPGQAKSGMIYIFKAFNMMDVTNTELHGRI